MPALLAFLGSVLVSFAIGLLVGGKIDREKPRGQLRILKDEDEEPFIFLEFDSWESKSQVETFEDGELVTFLVSHK